MRSAAFSLSAMELTVSSEVTSISAVTSFLLNAHRSLISSQPQPASTAETISTNARYGIRENRLRRRRRGAEEPELSLTRFASQLAVSLLLYSSIKTSLRSVRRNESD